jgi:ubiquinone/menaquinone biosynthesis C-methylase UbiE
MTDEGGATSPLSAREVGIRESQQRGWHNPETSELVPGVVIEPGMTVVDIGCGYGGYIEFCARCGANVTFIDRQEQTVRALENRLSYLSEVAVRGIVSECDPVPLEDACADLVICTEVLEHVPDADDLMREIVRIGNADTMFVLTVPDARGENLIKDVAHPDYFREPNHIRVFSADDFETLVKRHGLDVVNHDYRGGFWAIFYLFKWVTSQPGEVLFEAVHPITKLWTRTWAEVLEHPDSADMVRALNTALPQSQIIVARKSAHASIGED